MERARARGDAERYCTARDGVHRTTCAKACFSLLSTAWRLACPMCVAVWAGLDTIKVCYRSVLSDGARETPPGGAAPTRNHADAAGLAYPRRGRAGVRCQPYDGSAVDGRGRAGRNAGAAPQAGTRQDASGADRSGRRRARRYQARPCPEDWPEQTRTTRNRRPGRADRAPKAGCAGPSMISSRVVYCLFMSMLDISGPPAWRRCWPARAGTK